jgi:hypothetical protein
MAPTIVYVHGNGNKVRAELLKQQWDTALFGGPLGELSRMAYWAPLRYPEGPLADPMLDASEQLPASPLEATPPTVESAEEFIAATTREVRPATPGVEAASTSLESWLRDMTYTADALAEGESAVPPPASPFEALSFPAALRKAAFRALVKVTFKDVYAYFFGGFGEQMRAVVHAALRDITGPVVVLGHSLGSIIAYDVLRDPTSGVLDVSLLLTVGSPLAVTEVQDVVVRPLEVPASVAMWRNVSDARDVVALDHTIRPEYSPADRCIDFLVTNDSGNHHGVSEYLQTVPVRQPVLELFRSHADI